MKTLPSIKTLSPETVRVMIAEARGECVHKTWAFNGAGNYCTECKGLDYHSAHSPRAKPLSNYPESLDACAEFEKGMTEDELDKYVRILVTLQKTGEARVFMSSSIRRCHAFLIATGRATL